MVRQRVKFSPKSKFTIIFHRKLAAILFVAALGSVSSQGITLECEYYVTFFEEYACILEFIENLDPTAPVTFTGTHIGERTNDDVDVVYIGDSNTPFIMPEIFTAFPNFYELEILWSNLQSISLPPNTNMEALVLLDNNVTHIESGTFAGQDALWFLFMAYNNIHTIDENAFEGLSDLLALVLIGNEISEIAPTTFHPLTEIAIIDMEDNRLTSIGPEVFAENRFVNNIYLEYNNINEISPQFVANSRESLFFINLSGNRCVSNSFYLYEDTLWDIMIGNLQTCFNNFPGTVPEVRRISMEFTGNLAIFDDFGNILARV